MSLTQARPRQRTSRSLSYLAEHHMPCTRLYPDARPVRLPATHRLAVRMQLPVLISREENLPEVSTHPRGGKVESARGKRFRCGRRSRPMGMAAIEWHEDEPFV